MYKTLFSATFSFELYVKIILFQNRWFIVVLCHRAYFSFRIFKKSKHNQKVSLLNSQRYPLKEHPP